MRQLKKRTIALVLASVITVAGAFGAENYKNRIMSLEFKMNGANVDMTIQTRAAYSGSVNLRKQDASTYVLVLPEFDKASFTPDLKDVSNSVKSVSTTTMPYTSTGSGYTKITVKTLDPAVGISAKSALYLSDRQSDFSRQGSESENQEPSASRRRSSQQEELPLNRQLNVSDTRRNMRENTQEPEREIVKKEETSKPVTRKKEAENNVDNSMPPISANYQQEESNSGDFMIVILSIILVVAIVALLYLRAKSKMGDIVGDVPAKDEEENKKKTIQKTIKKLDKTYVNPPVLPSDSDFMPAAPVETVDSSEELEIVDLDEIFKGETKQTNSAIDIEEEENAALEDFLSGFSFEDDEVVLDNTKNLGFDETFYDEIIKSDNIRFSDSDIACINQLLNIEINDETLRNIKEYAVSNPEVKTLSKQEILEELTTTYAVSQNIVFTEEDTEILKKLINVELDDDFITDLRANPDIVKHIQEEASKPSEVRRKPKEILTLSVKDMLPDLSAALKAQGGRKIESNFKPDTVYFSEGYEVSKLSLNEALPDLASEVNNKEAYIAKPSAEIEYIDNNYEVETLNIANELPNLKDVIEHPDKYKEPEPEIFIPDEEALLRNIDNVKFKAFYDGFENSEVRYSEESDISIEDIQKEFGQFGIDIKSEPLKDNDSLDKYEDSADIYSNEYIDLDEQKLKSPQEESTSEELIRRIEASKIEREKIKEKLEQEKLARALALEKTLNAKKQENTQQGVCVFEGKTYSIVGAAPMTDVAGCYLVKNDYGYMVLGYVGENLTKIKSYSELKNVRIQARLNDTLENGTSRYLIRIGTAKFIVEVNDNRVRYVMDLC